MRPVYPRSWASRDNLAVLRALVAVVTFVAVNPPIVANPAAELNALWNAYGDQSDQSGQWTGGDRTASVPLPDGRTAWLFSDTFMGKVNPDRSRPASSPMPRNTIVVQEADGRLGETLHGGTPRAPRALVEVAGREHLWVADGIVADGELRVLYNRYETTGTGGLDVRSTGTSLATFTLPGLSLTELIEIPVSRHVAWGSELLDDGDHTYIYGAEDASEFPKHLRVARVPRGKLSGPWEFWTGTGWSRREEHAARLLTGVGTAFSVTKAGEGYTLVTVDSNELFSRALVAYTAPTPTGPFGNPRVLHRAPDAGNKRVIVYDATVHPQLGGPDRLVVSYNVNSLDLADTLADVRLYRPRFIEVAAFSGR